MIMEKIVAGLAIAGLAAGAHAETVTFDGDRAGAAPAGWICGSTGGGAPHWTVEADPTAPSPPNVLKQSGSGPFPWCVKQGTAIADGAVEVKFKPMAGREDRAGGVVWRWKDGDNYYVARANALENNVSLYYTEGGRRRTIKYVDAPVPGNAWHTLRVEFKGAKSASCSMARPTSSSTTATSRARALSASGPRPTASRRSTISLTSRRPRTHRVPCGGGA